MSDPVSNTISQGILAKLLASENITVHVGNYHTAFFDVKNRILGLPSWNVEHKCVSDLLIGHEVGHALWTPEWAMEEFRKRLPQCPFSILNIVEDVRIERLIQDRYPGLISSFNQGYEEFYRKDLFKIGGKDLNKLGFADRLNVKAKLRHLVSVSFTPDEQAIVDRCNKAETIEEVLDIVTDIYEMIKNNLKKPETDLSDHRHGTNEEAGPVDLVEDEDAKPKENSDDTKESPKPDKIVKDSDPKEPETDPKDDKDADSADKESDVQDDGDECDSKGEDDASDDADSSDIGSDSDSESDGESEEETGGSSGGEEVDDQSGGDGDDATDASDPTDESGSTDESDDAGNTAAPGSKGADCKPPNREEYDSLEDELKSSTLDNLDAELAAMQTDFGNIRPILPPSKAHIDRCVTSWKDVLESRKTRSSRELDQPETIAKWRAYKKDVRKNIQYLITDFERRKAAFQYSRSQTSDTGDIDVDRLYNYRFDDQIFRSITKLADAQNHGMMFFIDYSGSMGYDIRNVLDHVLNLVLFCKAVKIPFEVYGFTNPVTAALNAHDVPANQLSIDNTNIFCILSSEMNSSQFELACRQVHVQIRSNAYFALPCASIWENMTGTPLNETLVVAHELVARFRRKYAVQKMNVLVLTDGDGQRMRVGYDQTVNSVIKDSTSMRRPSFEIPLAGGKVRIGGTPSKTTAALIESLRTSLDCVVVGFFITSRRRDIKTSAVNAIQFSKAHGFDPEKNTNLCWQDAYAIVDKEYRNMRKNRCMFIKDGYNYDCYFVIDKRNAKISSTEFNPTIDADAFDGPISASTTNKMAKEFTKYSGDKKSSRLILAKFAELIA